VSIIVSIIVIHGLSYSIHLHYYIGVVSVVSQYNCVYYCDTPILFDTYTLYTSQEAALHEELSCLGYDAGSYGAYDKDGAEEAKALTLREEQVGIIII
jgi:hypothetical protein